MNREIKFRGRYEGDWLFGDLTHVLQMMCVDQTLVEQDTVGQFTGLYGKNSKEIYEGDILLFRTDIFTSKPIAVAFHNGAFGYFYTGDFVSFVGNTNFKFCINGSDESFEIIGNIHDNPELIKEK